MISGKSFSLSRPQCLSLKIKASNFSLQYQVVEREPVKLVGVVLAVSSSWLDQHGAFRQSGFITDSRIKQRGSEFPIVESVERSQQICVMTLT